MIEVGAHVVVRGAAKRNGWTGVVVVAEDDDDLVLIEYDAGRFWERRNVLFRPPARHGRDLETRTS